MKVFVPLICSLLMANASIAAEASLPAPPFIVPGPIADYAPRESDPVFGYRGLHEGLLGDARLGRLRGDDRTYSVIYRKGPGSVVVVVEQVEDTRWLLHEVEKAVRDRPRGRGMPPYKYELRSEGGQRIFFGSTTGDMSAAFYAWISGTNRVVEISWGRRLKLPDGTYVTHEIPPEFLTTYLALLPSSLPDIRFDVEHDRQYIRNEFDRDFEKLSYFLGVWKAHGAHAGEDEYADVLAAVLRIRDRRSEQFGGPSARDWQEELDRNIKTIADARRYESYDFLKSQSDELKTWWDHHRNDHFNVRAP